jgi:hypothetical protein
MIRYGLYETPRHCDTEILNWNTLTHIDWKGSNLRYHHHSAPPLVVDKALDV